MKITRDFLQNADRYQFDFNQCSYANGFAQIDSAQDAWYYGAWVNPKSLKIVEYAEGDLTVTEYDSEAELAEALANWFQPIKIDCLCDRPADKQISARLRGMGLARLLH